MAEAELAGQTALVTGGARRIGRAIALALAAERMNVVIHYHTSEAEATGLATELRRGGVEAWTLPADFREPEQTEELIPAAQALAGDLHLLVNSAATFPAVRIPELTWPDLAEAARLDAWTPFRLSQRFHEIIGRGQIVNLIDARVDSFDFQHAGYILAKHLLLAMTRMQAVQYAPDIAVNAIMPGLILPPPGRDEAYLDGLAHTVPLQKHGDADDIAAAAVFCARSTFMTGAMLHIDGGRHLKAYDDPGTDPHR